MNKVRLCSTAKAVLAQHVQVVFQGQPEGFNHVDVVRLHAPETAVLDFPDFVIHTAGHIGKLASRDGVRGWLLRSENRDFADVAVEGPDLEAFRVYGRVRWFGRVL